MTKSEFEEYVNSFSEDDLTEDAVLEICKKHRELNLIDRNWEQLNNALGHYKTTGENLRCWCKHKLAINGDLPENPLVLKGDRKPQDLQSNEVEDAYDKKMEELRKERYKNQSLLAHKYRTERQEARLDLFEELLENSISQLKVPKFHRFETSKNDKEYNLCFGDVHYGANFRVDGNEYSIEECERRFEQMLNEVIDFVKFHKINKLKVTNLGDNVQGLIHITDFKLNQIPVTDAVVGVAQLISEFLNSLSEYCDVKYYHVCYSNHTQIRPLGTQANVISAEDLEKVIFNIVKISLKNNQQVKILGDLSKDYIDYKVFDFNCCACHGHTIKKIGTALKDLSNHHRVWYDYLILGHTHSQKEYSCGCDGSHNLKTLVAPSFIGLDPYADSLLVSSKAGAVIFGFDEKYGQIEKYDIVLN